jgi:hypothetical protein
MEKYTNVISGTMLKDLMRNNMIETILKLIPDINKKILSVDNNFIIL